MTRRSFEALNISSVYQSTQRHIPEHSKTFSVSDICIRKTRVIITATWWARDISSTILAFARPDCEIRFGMAGEILDQNFTVGQDPLSSKFHKIPQPIISLTQSTVCLSRYRSCPQNINENKPKSNNNDKQCDSAAFRTTYVPLRPAAFNFFFSRTPTYNFSSTLYPQSCWCIIQVIHSL
jgi:hypothetical protein